jgi:hypothetical protein
MDLRYALIAIVMAASPICLADQTAIAEVLDALHERAAKADFEGYFALYHERAVFLGTDRDEYWPLAQFKTYARPHFDAGTGWTYHPTERFIHVAGNTAWFEERLQHASYGETRGTGVLLSTEEGWRVVQYNLTLPIPNALFKDVAADISEHYATR